MKALPLLKTACAALACALFVAAAPAGRPAFGAEFSTFGGTEIDDRGQGFSYAAFDLTQPINRVFSVSGRVMPSYLAYKYFSGQNLISVESPGASVLGGIKLHLGRTSFAFYGGYEGRDFRLHPNDPYASVKGHTNAGTVQGEMDSWLTKRMNFWGFASYSGTSNFFYERTRLKRQISNMDLRKPYTFYAGVEQFYGRNVDFHQQGFGPVLELVYMPQKLSLALVGGYKHDSTFGSGSYWGLQVYKGF